MIVATFWLLRATTQATMDRFVFHLILLVTMASQWATLHCRSGQWDNYNQYDQSYSDNAGVTFSQLPTESSEFPSFSESKAETPYDYYTANGDQRFSQAWDDSSTSFSAQSRTDDGFYPESTFAEQKTYSSDDNQFSFQANVDDDEVYFDTSAAKTIYKAPDAE